MHSSKVAAQPGANPGFPVNAVAPSTLLDAFLEIASWLQKDERQGEKPAKLLARWRRRRLRAFEAGKTDAADSRETERQLP